MPMHNKNEMAVFHAMDFEKDAYLYRRRTKTKWKKLSCAVCALGILFGVLVMPLLMKAFKKLSTVVAFVLSTGAFFGFELLFEDKVVVTSTETVTKTVSRLADWQMFMCRYIPPEEYAGVDIITSTSIRI